MEFDVEKLFEEWWDKNKPPTEAMSKESESYFYIIAKHAYFSGFKASCDISLKSIENLTA